MKDNKNGKQQTAKVAQNDKSSKGTQQQSKQQQPQAKGNEKSPTKNDTKKSTDSPRTPTKSGKDSKRAETPVKGSKSTEKDRSIERNKSKGRSKSIERDITKKSYNRKTLIERDDEKKKKEAKWQQLIKEHYDKVEAKKQKKDKLGKKKKKNKPKANNIKVIIRVRKLLRNEVGKENIITLYPTDDKKIKVGKQGDSYEALFDMTFGYYSTQHDVFDYLLEAVEKVLKGINSTIFTYGQTGTGKTYTMFGADWTNLDKYDAVSLMKVKKQDDSNQFEDVFTYNELNINPFSEDNGIIPRAVNHIFAEIELKNLKKKTFSVFVTYMQIYNEKIFDLLSDKAYDDKKYDIREDKHLGIYVDGLSEHGVDNIYECINLLRKGERNRKKRQTAKNDVSSRSHTVFQILIIEEADDKIKKSKLNLCDLAGSEKLEKEQNLEKIHLSELGNINTSLTTLGNVINSLATGKPHVPYRDSKLTRILQDSLGGETSTYLIATLSPSILNYEETLSTLKFAERAKKIIKTKAIEEQDYDETTIRNLKEELESLKTVLNMKKGGHNSDLREEVENLRKENEKMKKYVLAGYDRNKLIEENEALTKDLIRFQSEAGDRDTSINETLKSNKSSLPNIYSQGFSNSKYRDSYENSRDISYLNKNDHGNSNKLYNSQQFYKNEIENYERTKYKKYSDHPQNKYDYLLSNNNLDYLANNNEYYNQSPRYSKQIQIANERIRQLELLENNVGTRFSIEKANNLMYKRAVASQQQRSKSEERKEKIKKIQGHLDRIKYLYKEKEYDPVYLEYVTKKKKLLESKKSAEKKEKQEKSGTTNKESGGVNSLKTGYPSKSVNATDTSGKTAKTDDKTKSGKSDDKNTAAKSEDPSKTGKQEDQGKTKGQSDKVSSNNDKKQEATKSNQNEDKNKSNSGSKENLNKTDSSQKGSQEASKETSKEKDGKGKDSTKKEDKSVSPNKDNKDSKSQSPNKNK